MQAYKKNKAEVIDTMAKKLAVQSELTSGKKNHWLRWILLGASLLTLSCIITVLLYFNLPDQEKVTAQNAEQSPLAKINSAYQEGTLSINRYVQLLAFMLTKYDSVPSQFKTERAFSSDTAIYLSISKVWPLVSDSVKNKILTDLPVLEQRLQDVSKSQ